MKIFKRVLLGVVLLIVVAALVVYFNLNRIVKNQVQAQATDSLNLTTTLDSARLALFGGQLSLNGLQIASPQGFSAPHLITLGGADVGVHYGQLTKDPVRINHITLKNPTLMVEQAGGKMNFQAVMAQDSKTPQQPPAADGKRKEGEPMKLIIDQLDVSGAVVVIRPGLPGLKDEIRVLIPSLSLTNIGNAEGNGNGAAIKEVVMQVVTALVAKAQESGGLPAQLRQILNVNLNDVAQKLGGKFQNELAKIAPALGQDLSQQLDKTMNGLGKNGPGKNLGNDVLKDLDTGGKIDPGKMLGGVLNKGADKPRKRDRQPQTQP